MRGVEKHHAEWLSLIETTGPFLTVPTLKRALPDGLDATPAALADLRLAYAEWQAQPELLGRWVRWVLEELLGLRGAVAEATEADPSHRVAEHGVTIRPDFVVRDRGREGEPPVLLVHVMGEDGDGWAATPVDRAAELARASHVPLALVTDGERWTLVWSRQGQTTGLCTWRADIWLQEDVTLRAFATLLGARRFFSLPVEEGLAALLDDSAQRQQEVTDRLGAQVRRAVELLIATLDREDRDRHGELLRLVPDEEVYRGTVTVMMRLVFLFVAEERRLLPVDDPRYAETLAASTLRAQLQERADRDGEEVLERGRAAWHRILALFRAVHGGIEHDALRLPAYGGGLFDPDRYPFLEGRREGSDWHAVAADPLPVDDRTVLHLLDALQSLDQGGRDGARVLLSYRALDVEQIGHVYEGLLDHTAIRVTDTALGLSGKHEPELTVSEVEGWTAAGDEEVGERLAKETGRSVKAITKALDAEIEDESRSRLRAACANDDALLERVLPYHALLRADLRGDPEVLLAGSLFVTQALDRRASGTYYTPRSLAEEVVQHALDPVAYAPGPAEKADPAAWRLMPAAELLNLKVADIAMGSGAFLVAACRYLAARLQEAWAHLDPAGEWTAFGRPRAEAPDDPQLPVDAQERELLAHRLIAERCLYGVDKNPMAVEMAKLSLWLITLAKDRPFSFVDHALRCGDSLLGVTDLRQLRVMHMNPAWRRQSSLDLGFEEIERAADRALAFRRELEAFVVRDPLDAQRKARLLAAAEEALDDARLVGDLVVGAALSQLPGADPLAGSVAGEVRTLVAGEENVDRAAVRTALRDRAADWLVERTGGGGNGQQIVFDDRRPLHWPLEFPEVSAQEGFDAIVGNPPFQGGKRITGALGTRYRDHLVQWVAGSARGSADLVAYFYLRAGELVRKGGGFGLIATNTLAQGDTREVGLDQLTEDGLTLHRAVASEPWPGGAANLEMATVWARRGGWDGGSVLDRAPAVGITSSLTLRSRVEGRADQLAAAVGRSHVGSLINGMGFLLEPDEARKMMASDERNEEVVKPYLNGEDLNSRPDGSPSRYVIDFRDWTIERAQEYPSCLAVVEDRVKPVRDEIKRRAYRELWWRFAEPQMAMRRAIASLERCIVLTSVSKVVQPMFVPTGIVYSHMLAVFAYDDDAHFGLLSSGFHWWWAVTHASTMRTDIRYTPSDCFETFAQPTLTPSVADLGGRLHQHRSSLMLDRQEGLTKTYNRVHDPDDQSDDILRLQEIHTQLDHAVRDAYGWHDLDLGHGFHDTRFGVRYTFEPVARQEVLDRLLELNHESYADEVRRGLHDKRKPAKKRAPAAAGALSLDVDG